MHNSLMFRLQLVLVAVIAAAVAGAAERDGKQRPVYSWVDERGVTQYGDSIPPQYSKTERVIRNRQGVEIGKLDAQMTPAQLEESRRIKEIAQAEAERDRFLLTTYTSVADIEELRDTRLQQLGDQRKSTEGFVAVLSSRLDELQQEALAYRPYNSSASARRMPDRLAEDLVRTMNEMRSQRSILDSRRQDEENLRAQFQSDIDRYRSLRGGKSSTR